MSTSISLHRYDHRPSTAERLALAVGGALVRWAERTAAARRSRATDRIVDHRRRAQLLDQAESRRHAAIVLLHQGPRQF